MSAESELHFHVSEWPALMSREQAAAYLSIGLDSLRLLIASGSIKPVTLPGAVKCLKFRRYDLDKFIDSLEAASSSKAIRQRQKLTEAARAAKQVGLRIG